MTKLVKKAMQGDPDAFLKLMDVYQDTMLRIAHGYLLQEADIADVMQDTILNAYEHLSELNNPRYFKTWLIRILLNNCNHVYQKNKKFISMDELECKAVDEFSQTDTALFHFHELLSYVSKENRLCFQLYYGEKFTTKEISEILHINENTIRSRMRREKMKLKTLLQNNGYVSFDEKKGVLL